MEKKLAGMVCLLMSVWFVAWTPYATMCFWIVINDAEGITPIIGIIPTVCCKISAGVNALFYGVR